MRYLSIIICIFLILAALVPAVSAGQGGGQDMAPEGRGPPVEASNQSAGPPVESPGIAVRETVRAEINSTPVDPAGLRNTIRTRQELQAEEVPGLPVQARARYAHENQVRNAVFALLAAENMTGIGPLVAEVAREYNASVNAQWGDEVAMEQRSGITLALFGGNREAAERIRVRAEENERRIEEIRGIILTSSSTDPELSMILLEQLGQMEEEQRRLMERAMVEEQKKGFFSWIFG
ncbi:hypothetical protein FTO68_00005 [Methanocalculus taiwanensis]|uniref:Uncharacterized protein n=1 Tax=Methanocalculus taiwanensis TaxID=106207 RepID=A0ABD4TI22_9EURY|nr:hypothetical protein [Methanocalculus taiwanensis]MCQ1537393.1 hypothetical protein [Methanocalculus taiwanensis]